MMKKYIQSSIVELKDGSTENIMSPDDFRWLIEDRLGSECADYYDEIVEDLCDVLDETLPYIDDDYTKDWVLEELNAHNYTPVNN